MTKAKRAAELVTNLTSNEIYVKILKLLRLNENIRITLGTPDENKVLLEVIRNFYSS